MSLATLGFCHFASMESCRIIGLLFFCITCLSACTLLHSDDFGARLRSSESCYAPLRPRIRPLESPIPEGTEVPLLDKVPQGSRILGTFKISSDFAFVLKALQYNARRVGADALVIQKLTWWDIKHWEEPRKVVQTTRIPVSDSEKQEYQNKLKEYEAMRREGKPAERPEQPKESVKEETVSYPGHWSVNGGSTAEAVMLELPPVRAEIRP